MSDEHSSSSDNDLTDTLESELFGDLTMREAMHAYGLRSSLDTQSVGGGEQAETPSTSEDCKELSSHAASLPSPPASQLVPPAPDEAQQQEFSGMGRRSSGTTQMLADIIASTPRPDFEYQDLAKQAALKASRVLRDSPHLRGEELLAALRKADEDVAIEYDLLLEKHSRTNSQTFLHHQVYGGNHFSGWLEKKSGGRKNSMEVSIGSWRRRWFVLKDSCVAYYLSDKNDTPRDALLYDNSFHIKRDVNDSCKFKIKTSSRSLVLRADTAEQAKLWIESIEER